MSSFDQAELELFRDNVRRFLENEIQPHYEQWEKRAGSPTAHREAETAKAHRG